VGRAWGQRPWTALALPQLAANKEPPDSKSLAGVRAGLQCWPQPKGRAPGRAGCLGRAWGHPATGELGLTGERGSPQRGGDDLGGQPPPASTAAPHACPGRLSQTLPLPPAGATGLSQPGQGCAGQAGAGPAALSAASETCRVGPCPRTLPATRTAPSAEDARGVPAPQPGSAVPSALLAGPRLGAGSDLSRPRDSRCDLSTYSQAS